VNLEVTSLQAAQSAEHYELHLAAIEHSLLSAIIGDCSILVDIS